MARKPSFSSFSSCSSSSSSSYGWNYDVFLSFRGTDTRYGFAGFLYKALCDKGIRTFFDDEDLQSGEEITPSLVKAIQESRIAIPVFSINYASSRFCLDELVHFMECVKGKGRLVLPVFYDVDPSHVRHQRGSYGEALAALEERFKDDKEKVEKWREALHQAANLSGYHFKHGEGYEHKFIGRIVEAVSCKIRRVALPVADYPVGLESQMLQVTSLLDVGSNDGVHMVGIHGIGGVGKTTLALAVYNLITDHFEGICFLENVRENSNKYGFVHLQSVLLSELLGEKEIKLTGVQQGKAIIQHRLKKKNVLLILDDVDNQEQLQAIVGEADWFGPGSRVIITTRDKHVLTCHGVERTYEVEGLNKEDAIELIIWKAFKTDIFSPSYVHVLSRAVTYACGLPLALDVIGSNLFGKSVEDWQSALDRYERIPHNKIQKILKVSFDGLEEDEQSVFLDIACCFKGYYLGEVENILCAHYGGGMKYHIGVLVEKSLIKISRHGEVTLHDLVEDMGKEIVRQESPKEPGKRSRLWFHEDIVHVLEDNQGTLQMEIIHLDFPFSNEEEVKWDGKAFTKLKNLKTLIIKNGHFSKGPKHLPNSLRVLEWQRYPSQFLPSNFHPKKLVICELPYNCFMSLELAGSFKKFVNLKDLNFSGSKCLTHVPDVSGLPNLERMLFDGCENLITIHHSVGFLDKLQLLRAMSCHKIRSFPPLELTSLSILCLSWCSGLEKFPEILGKMENLTELKLNNTGIKEFPNSFRNLTRLRKLTLRGCRNFRIPSSIVMMPKLTSFTAFLCNTLLPPKQDESEEAMSSMASSSVKSLYFTSSNLSDDYFPMGLALFANVNKLQLSGNNFTILPACLKECRFLRKLYVNECNHLREIRGIPPNLEHFSAVCCKSWTPSCSSMLLNQELHEAGNTNFILPGARVPEWFEHHSRGPSISFWFRNKFPSVALCLVIGMTEKHDRSVMVIINGNKCYTCNGKWRYLWNSMSHIILYDPQNINLKDNLVLEKEWNHAEIYTEAAKEIGIHVFKQKNLVEDIRFGDPYKRRKIDDGPQ